MSEKGPTGLRSSSVSDYNTNAGHVIASVLKAFTELLEGFGEIIRSKELLLWEDESQQLSI